jgi:hypothetical protein
MKIFKQWRRLLRTRSDVFGGLLFRDPGGPSRSAEAEPEGFADTEPLVARRAWITPVDKAAWAAPPGRIRR